MLDIKDIIITYHTDEDYYGVVVIHESSGEITECFSEDTIEANENIALEEMEKELIKRRIRLNKLIKAIGSME